MLPRSRVSQFNVWLIPLLYALGALLLGFTIPRLAYNLFPGFLSSISADAAIGIYSAVASGMLALTGIVFSLTFVMVQFSATAYSPRLVLWVARDPVMSHAMGVFTATFLYALASLAWVDRHGSGRVPIIGITIITTLLVVSIFMFVALIQRVGMLQVNHMLVFTGDQGREIIETIYPPIQARPSPGSAEILQLPCCQTLSHHGKPRVLQAIDIPSLLEVAGRADCVVEVTAQVGDSVLDSTPILRVFGPTAQWRRQR